MLILLFTLTTLYGYSQSVGEPAPDFSLTDTNGETFQLSAYQGKVITVFIFGYACPSCKAIAPDVQTKLADAYNENENYLIVGVDAWNGSTAQVKNFVSSTNITFPALEMGSEMANSWGTTYDRIIVIDENGNMAFKGSGLASSHIDQAVNAVNESLNNLTTSIYDMKKPMFEAVVYPNPADDYIFIETNNNLSTYSVSITDINGRTTLLSNERQESFSEKNRQFDISNYQSGLYFLNLEADGFEQTLRLLIQ